MDQHVYRVDYIFVTMPFFKGWYISERTAISLRCEATQFVLHEFKLPFKLSLYCCARSGSRTQLTFFVIRISHMQRWLLTTKENICWNFHGHPCFGFVSWSQVRATELGLSVAKKPGRPTWKDYTEHNLSLNYWKAPGRCRHPRLSITRRDSMVDIEVQVFFTFLLFVFGRSFGSFFVSFVSFSF